MIQSMNDPAQSGGPGVSFTPGSPLRYPPAFCLALRAVEGCPDEPPAHSPSGN
jgi:hypothetical protein